MELQEIIARGRFIFDSAPKRLEVFKHINGRRSAKQISKEVGKSLANTLGDLQKMKDVGLIAVRVDKEGRPVKKENSLVYAKAPLVRQIPISYFQSPIKTQKRMRSIIKRKAKTKGMTPITVSSENEILDICNSGENQLYEFKAAGTEVKKITKEIAAMLNTKMGGIVFYGVDDDGVISGTDKTGQQMDQPLQNSLKDNIAPCPIVEISQKKVMGQTILFIIIAPWNRKDVYHYCGRVLIRKGTNVFGTTPDESKKLHKGEYVI